MMAEPQAPPEFLEACILFERLVGLALPNECRTERMLFPATTAAAEIRIWQGEEWLFSLWLSAYDTQLVGDHWQRLSNHYHQERERLGHPLTDQELRLLARTILLELLPALCL